jgi:hypothetical protein
MSSSALPEAEMIAVTPGSRIYLEALESYGLLEGEQGGRQRLPDSVREVQERSPRR